MSFVNILDIVDFPLPDSPTKDNISFLYILNDTLSTAFILLVLKIFELRL